MARTKEPAKQPRINVPLKGSLRSALNKKAKKEGRLVPAVISELVAGYVGKAAK